MKTELPKARYKTLKGSGFTLVELLVVISILGVLVSVTLVAFRSSQARSRDAQRKNDLKQIASALELFYSDYGKYPDEFLGRIKACPYNPSGAVSCQWGSGEFTDGVRTYFKVLPSDPVKSANYYYRLVPNSTNDKYQLFAALENSEDPNCINRDCASPSIPSGVSCGSRSCNFSVTSTNTTPAE